jgi:hypothetical protein
MVSLCKYVEISTFIMQSMYRFCLCNLCTSYDRTSVHKDVKLASIVIVKSTLVCRHKNMDVMIMSVC